ncbi:hypothetical protein QVD17_05742 [Tagetes erecta]|uniref:Cyclin-dependent kinase inhibitor domain-containing protein n=1 Tax=Tagetes erecta TaxID=13708 RepID=A0AAD8LKD2_TARER|nr:hypothetical protein QVD17_05742 [Tagetes erecta]
MVEETGTSGYECTEQTPVTEASNSISDQRNEQFEDTEVTISGKRRRIDCNNDEDVLKLQYRDIDVNFRENVASTAVSGTSDHVNSLVMYSTNDDCYDLISDLKDESVSVTDILMSSNDDGFSSESSTSISSVVCLESEDMESSLSSSIKKKKSPAPVTTTTTEATSRRKPPPPAELMPSAAELEEFFSKAEKYEQKRFAKKYNFDIVKDIPMEGRYQWLPLKP